MRNLVTAALTLVASVGALVGAGADPLRMAVVRGYGPKRIGTNVPEDVRLTPHPDLSFEELEDGWCERFGAAKETVRAYYRRVRARCDRSWPALIRYFRENHLDFLDDGHLSCYTPRLHTEAELKEDVAFLRKFDASTLEGDATKRFDDLVFMAEHALATWKANVTKSEVDKAALHAMRVRNKRRLGDGTRKWYKVAEVLLWDDTPRNRIYYNDFAVPRLADAYERTHVGGK